MLFRKKVHPLGGGPNFITQPTVTRLATTNLEYPVWCELDGWKAAFDNTGTDAEWLIEFAGRECYQSFHNPAGRTTREYVQNIIGQQHYSVLEHANVTYRLEGISRSLTHELIRHRHFSYSQLSQRYVDSRDTSFVVPPFVLTDPELFRQFKNATVEQQEHLIGFEDSFRVRHPNVPQKQIREAVRSLAPNSIETKIVITGNLRTWRDMLPKRWNSHADAEIDRLSELLREDLMKIYPAVFEDIAYE